MEDRYLSKAKRLDNEEWVQGYLVYDNRDKLYRIIMEIQYSTGTCITTDNAPRVDSSTICRCTGSKDKNGKLIWENDIMVAHLDKDNPEDITYAIVAWSENGWVTIENDSDDLNPIDDFTTENFEVVSTRFDNKKLLESEDKYGKNI